MQKPLLYKFMKLCNTSQDGGHIYDKEMEILVSYENDERIPAILSRSLGTKKENLEKGEDESPSLFF